MERFEIIGPVIFNLVIHLPRPLQRLDSESTFAMPLASCHFDFARIIR